MVGIMTHATKTLRDKYMVKAISIGGNAIKLANDFFNFGIYDDIKFPLGGNWTQCKRHQWTPSDLDRALDAMEAMK